MAHFNIAPSNTDAPSKVGGRCVFCTLSLSLSRPEETSLGYIEVEQQVVTPIPVLKIEYAFLEDLKSRVYRYRECGVLLYVVCVLMIFEDMG